MDVSAFLICIQANESKENGLNILGTFDGIQSTNFPLQIPHLTVVLQLRFSKIEDGEHEIKLNLIDQDGNPAIPSIVTGKTLIKVQEGKDSGTTNLILHFVGTISIQKPGKYVFKLAVDGKEVAESPLYVTKK